jgi:excisionase family DNA binding protein
MLHTITEAAALLRLHRNTITTMIRDGRLEAVNLNPSGRRPHLAIGGEVDH